MSQLQIIVAVAVSILMASFAILLRIKHYYATRSGMQLHITMIIWIGAFVIQGLITVLADFMNQYGLFYAIAWRFLNLLKLVVNDYTRPLLLTCPLTQF